MIFSLKTVLDFVNKEKFDSIIIVTESTSVYDYHVCAYLSSQLSIVGTSVIIYAVNAKSISNYKKFYTEMKKNDPVFATGILSEIVNISYFKNIHLWQDMLAFTGKRMIQAILLQMKSIQQIRATDN